MELGLNTMRTAASFGFWGAKVEDTVAAVQLAESCGYHSVWTSESSGTDAVTALAWLGAVTRRVRLGTAVLQVSSRTPAMTAMTAATLDRLSGGRVILGLGVSGPGVVEAWHNHAFRKPLTRLREHTEIVRRIVRREPVEFHGSCYDLPYRGEAATDLAQPIRLAFHPRRARIPIYLAAMGPRSIRLGYELADGIIPPIYSPYREKEFFDGVPQEARTRPIAIAPFVPVAMGADLQECYDVAKPFFAFWLGAMGTRTGPNYYYEFACRIGFPDAATAVRQLYTAGKISAAIAAVPNQLVDEVSLCGTRERVADRLAAWKESAVTTPLLTNLGMDDIPVLAELAAGL